MKKNSSFTSAEDIRLDEKIENTLKREFTMPKEVEAAKKKVFDQIRTNQLKQDYANDIARKQKSVRRYRGVFFKTVSGLAATAAVFSVVCISNPALAAKIPLLGHVFETIGESLGYSGDYAKYAQPLQTEEETSSASATEESELVEATMANAENTFTKTIDGVTVTLSEIYCNDAALNIGVLIESEEPFPESAQDQFGNYIIYVPGTEWKVSFEDTLRWFDTSLEAQPVDEHTLAGVIRADLSGVEYPDEFHASICIPKIAGDKKESTRPEIPKELVDEYHAGLKAAGLNYDDFESFTEEEKEIDHQLMNEMYRKYEEIYPGVMDILNEYDSWWVEGPWEFELDVKVNHEDTIVKDINDIDENGIGIGTITKTPFELKVETIAEPLYDYFTVVLDADGDILPYGSSGSTEVWAIQNRDISKIDVYVCDFMEYMDELKGYYWSDDYEENKKTKTFKQLLDERALHHTEVIFE